MPKFTVRVELHDATSQDYADLADNMLAAGMPDTITGADGTVYRLPGGEYNFEGAATIDQVRSAASDAAKQVVPKFAVLVTEGTRKWTGLKKA